jgi:HSP20 family protein
MALKHAIEEVKETAHGVGEKVSHWMPWNWGKARVPVRPDRASRGGDPHTALMSMRDELDDLYRRFSEHWPGLPSWGLSGGFGSGAGFLDTHWPAVDLDEDDDRYIVRVELPGVDAEDVDLSVDEHMLTITGEKREHRETDRRGVRRVESCYGSFHRTVPLPAAIDPDAVKARCRKGELEVELPKARPSSQTRRRITVE